MKPSHLLTTLVLLAIPALASATPAEDFQKKVTAQVKADVQAMNQATIDNDFATIADFTHPALVQLMGGREKMIAAMEKGTKEMNASGAKFISSTIQDPTQFVLGGDDVYTIVPYEMKMTVPGAKLTQKTFVIGISSDKGLTWKYVSPGKDRSLLKKILPNLPESLKLPEPQEPVIEKTATPPSK